MTHQTQIQGFVRFHGMTLLVIRRDGLDYIKAKALSDALGMKWRSTRETLSHGDNLVLYGTERMFTPQIDAQNDNLGPTGRPQTGTAPTNDGAIETENTPQKDTDGDLYIRLDRAQMFLARVNTNNLRAKGNTTSAELLLDLQIEWAEVLHKYEQQKALDHFQEMRSKAAVINNYLKVLRAQSAAPDVQARQSLSKLAAQLAADAGAPYQQEMPGV